MKGNQNILFFNEFIPSYLLKFFFLKKDFTYLFLERGEGRETEWERNINVWLPLLLPQLGIWLQPRYVLSLGIEPATLCSQASTRSTEPHQLGHLLKFLWCLVITLFSHKRTQTQGLPLSPCYICEVATLFIDPELLDYVFFSL